MGFVGSSIGPRAIGRQRNFGLMAVLGAAFQFGGHPAYSLVGNGTRGSAAQLRVPDQGPYLGLCMILSSEINNNESI